MDLNQYKFTNLWYENTGELIKNYESDSVNGEVNTIYLDSKEIKNFFEMKYKNDSKYKRNVRIKKLKRIMSFKKQ